MGVDFGAVFVLIVTVNQKLKSVPKRYFPSFLQKWGLGRSDERYHILINIFLLCLPSCISKSG